MEMDLRQDLWYVFERIFEGEKQIRPNLQQIRAQKVAEGAILKEYKLTTLEDLLHMLIDLSIQSFKDELHTIFQRSCPKIFEKPLDMLIPVESNKDTLKTLLERLDSTRVWKTCEYFWKKETIRQIFDDKFDNFCQTFFEYEFFVVLRRIIHEQPCIPDDLWQIDSFKRAVCDQMAVSHHKYSFQKVFFSSLGSNFCLSRYDFVNNFSLFLKTSFSSKSIQGTSSLKWEKAPTPQFDDPNATKSKLQAKFILDFGKVCFENKGSGVHTGSLISFEKPGEEKKDLWYVKVHQGAENKETQHKQDSTKFFPIATTVHVFSQSLLPGGLVNTHFLDPTEIITYSLLYSLGYGPEPLFFVDLYEYSGIRILTRSLGSEFKTFNDLIKEGNNFRNQNMQLFTESLLELSLLSYVLCISDLHGGNFGFIGSELSNKTIRVVDFMSLFGHWTEGKSGDQVRRGYQTDEASGSLKDIYDLKLDFFIEKTFHVSNLDIIIPISRYFIQFNEAENISILTSVWGRLKDRFENILVPPKLNFHTWPIDDDLPTFTKEAFLGSEAMNANDCRVNMATSIEALHAEYIQFFERSNQQFGDRTYKQLFGYDSSNIRDKDIKNPEFLQFEEVCKLFRDFPVQLSSRIGEIDLFIESKNTNSEN